ncbi:CoA ester lyase [Microlunatus aurantiacus]|uniref:CoA ester lyase n=1 Tax=Microlunatus aurantiacus TaxID=446786 RepID=A0ABP7D063_9ACTN
MNDLVRTAVTALFVPGDRPDRYAKAATSGADLVIIDLEDAVAPPDKDAARAAVRWALSPGSDLGPRAVPGPPAALRALVRINDPATAAGAADLTAVAELVGEPGHGVVGVMVPKAARAEDLGAAIRALAAAEPGPAPAGPDAADRLAVVALIESALGVAEVRALATLPGLTRLAFGALDFALDVGADVDAVTGQVARAEVVIASRAAGLPAPWESPSTSLGDARLIEETSRAARLLGFGGRLCIHPAQLAPVRAGFAPSAEEVAWARAVAGAGSGVSRVGDEMVDRPVLERARAILRRAAP